MGLRRLPQTELFMFPEIFLLLALFVCLFFPQPPPGSARRAGGGREEGAADRQLSLRHGAQPDSTLSPALFFN